MYCILLQQCPSYVGVNEQHLCRQLIPVYIDILFQKEKMLIKIYLLHTILHPISPRLLIQTLYVNFMSCISMSVPDNTVVITVLTTLLKFN